MKHSFFIIVLMFLLGNVANAQTQQISLKERAETVSKEMDSRYELSDEQCHAVKKALLAYGTQLQNAKTDAAQRKAGADAFAAALQTVMTSPQYNQYQSDAKKYQKAQKIEKIVGNTTNANHDEWGAKME